MGFLELRNGKNLQKYAIARFFALDFKWSRLNPHKSIKRTPGRFEALGYIIRPLEKPGRAGLVQKSFKAGLLEAKIDCYNLFLFLSIFSEPPRRKSAQDQPLSF